MEFKMKEFVEKCKENMTAEEVPRENEQLEERIKRIEMELKEKNVKDR